MVEEEESVSWAVVAEVKVAAAAAEWAEAPPTTEPSPMTTALVASGAAASSSSRGPGTTTVLGSGEGMRSTRTKGIGTFLLPFELFLPGPFFFFSFAF